MSLHRSLADRHGYGPSGEPHGAQAGHRVPIAFGGVRELAIVGAEQRPTPLAILIDMKFEVHLRVLMRIEANSVEPQNTTELLATVAKLARLTKAGSPSVACDS